MTNLVDRYVFTALRRIPEQQRSDIDRELRASIEDAVESRLDAGESREAAVEAALTELGDPDRLADSYSGRPGYLIGPEMFPIWRSVMKTLFTMALPVVIAVIVVIQLFDDPSIGTVIGTAVSSLITVGAHMAFWTTLSFAVVERTGVGSTDLKRDWTLKDLPRYEPGRATTPQLISGLVWVALLITALVLQQFTFTDVPVLDPANWAFWWPVLIALFVLRGLYHVWLHRVGRWTMTVAAVNAALTVATTAPMVWLLATDRFFNPAFHGFLELEGGDVKTWLTTTVIAVVVLGGLWDIFETTKRAVQERRGLPTQVPGTGL
ncbi:permease prefix domain 1-containing protein [Actinoplanes awajinensis]|uniref:Uncharacterized protein n=1 Tax=Actinoplanes awajinensis subsp. mycoplanecinus TaxID=135947 RepID=A0A124G7Y4_9ACTN|nr:permease prefix domain 1-containing protein [Actinoplanes awajinensis]KUL24281.1 hypothetical protein ADL15_43930 [Actinoplanes awajinensis subsp. mycoplanecinus]